MAQGNWCHEPDRAQVAEGIIDDRLAQKAQNFFVGKISNTEFGKSLVQKYICYKLDRFGREGDMRIVIGASGKVPDGWIGTEYPYVDVSNASTFGHYFRKNTVSAFSQNMYGNILTGIRPATLAPIVLPHCEPAVI